MPKYEFPEIPPEPKRSNQVEAPESPDRWDIEHMRRHHAQVSKEIVEGMEIGTEVVMVFRGKITGLEMRESQTNDHFMNRSEVTIDADSVEIYPQNGNEFSDLVDDD